MLAALAVTSIAVAGAPPAQAQTYPYKVKSNIRYNHGSGSPAERGDLYLPEGVPGGAPLPVVVVIHGGDWSNRSPERTKTYKNIVVMAEALASAGVAAFSIDYALYDPVNAPDVGVWPQNLEDCKTAVQFLRVNAAKYGLDPNRVGVAGTSAGAHLAALVTVTDESHGDYEPARPYPGVSTQVGAAWLMYAPYTNISANGKIPAWLGPDATYQTQLDATPSTYVRAGLPPMLLSHGTADTTVPIQQAYDFQSMLAADANLPGMGQVEWSNTSVFITYDQTPGLIIMDDLTHGFPIGDTGKKDGFLYDLRPNMTSYFQAWLPPAPPPQ